MSEDLIKRSDAIEAIHNYWKKRLDTLPKADIQQTDKILEHNKILCNFVNAIPSADRPQGEWIDRSGGIEGAWNYCSVCGEQAIDLYDFCPNCGAKMKGADDE